MSDDEYEEYDTPSDDAKTGEAGDDPLQEVEIEELERINDLEDKATIDDKASFEERTTALLALDSLLLLLEGERQHSPVEIQSFEQTIEFLHQISNETEDRHKDEFIEGLTNLKVTMIEELKRLIEGRGQANPLEEIRQTPVWEQLGFSRERWERMQEDGARQGDELEIPSDDDQNEEEKREVAKAKAQKQAKQARAAQKVCQPRVPETVK